MAFLTGYTKRKKITIDETKVDSTLTDFPVRVYLNADTDIGAVSNADGYDIRFTSSDGETLLKYEREDFAISGGAATGNFWVKVPSVSSSADTEIYIYYRAEDTADGADPTNVWDSNFKARYSMKDLTTSTIEDSTSNSIDGTKKGANEPVEATGQIGKCQSFDGSNDTISIGSVSSFSFIQNTGVFTLGFLAKFSNNTSNHTLAGNRPAGSNKGFFFAYNNLGTKTLRIIIGKGTDPDVIDSSTDSNVITDTNWHYVSVKGDGSNIKFYVDATEISGSGSFGTKSTGDSTNVLQIGSNYLFNYFGGLMDEVRISDVERSSSWIKADYNSCFDTLITWGEEEEKKAAYTPVLLSLVIPAMAATYDLEATASFTPLEITQIIPDMTAEASWEAIYDPAQLNLTIPDFTASYICEIEATYTPLEITQIIPDMTAIGRTKLISIDKNSGIISNIEKTGLGMFLSADDEKPIYDDRDDKYIMISFGESLNRTLKNTSTLKNINKS